MVGQSFLQTGSSLHNLDGLASTAIWANCQVGDDNGDLPTLSNCSASAILLIISPTSGGASQAGDGGLVMGTSLLPSISLLLLITLWFLFSPPSLELLWSLTCWNLDKES